MNIKILDSWLREYLKTDVKPEALADKLSLSSVSVESLEKIDSDDYLYDIEITTNRVDLMSVRGLARECAAVLNAVGKKAKFVDREIKLQGKTTTKSRLINIKNDPTLVKRVTAVVMEVKTGESPKKISERLEFSGIRSINNLVDVTNYIMREMGHPAHVFDYDLIRGKEMTIRKSKKGETITTLDGKKYTLNGGDIIAEDKERIIDLLGIMGLENSVVKKGTKRILLFLDNNDPLVIRKTSMSLALRTEAVALNEKNVDPELMIKTLARGIELYEKIANGKVISDVIDIYPRAWEPRSISIEKDKIEKVIGIKIPVGKVKSILVGLGFGTVEKNNTFVISIPSWRDHDIFLEEDIIEEIARMYGYDQIPSILPPMQHSSPFNLDSSEFYWETRIKNNLKYWGFTECYTYSMVSEKMYEGPTNLAIAIKNPLTNKHIYMRRTIVPSLLEVLRTNQAYEDLQFFELSNTYLRREGKLPKEVLHLAGVIKGKKALFYNIKGIVEGLLSDLGIKKYSFKKSSKGGLGADIYIEKDFLGEIEILEDNLSNFELDFSIILKHARFKRVYKPIPIHPSVIEDIRITTDRDVSHQEIVTLIKKQSNLIESVELFDVYEEKRTYRIIYLDRSKNLTNKEVTPIRESVYKALKDKFNANIG